MPRKCCVPNCNSNYKRKNEQLDHVTFIRIRSECRSDEVKLDCWIKKIPRDDFTVTEDTVICIKHFAPQFILTHDSAVRSDGSILSVIRKVPTLSADAYPSLFENCPAYLSSEPPAKRRNPDCRRNDLEKRGIDNLEEWMNNDRILHFDQLASDFTKQIGTDGKWQYTSYDNVSFSTSLIVMYWLLRLVLLLLPIYRLLYVN